MTGRRRRGIVVHMSTVSEVEAVLPPLAELSAEPWGMRLRRARGEVEMRDAAQTISRLAWPVSHAVLARLEKRAEPPTDRRSKLWAVLLLVSYGYDPAKFGLSLDVVPDSINLRNIVYANTRPGETHIARQNDIPWLEATSDASVLVGAPDGRCRQAS